MSETPKTDHAYDGIEEYDNPLPGWWKWLFVATIVICPFYWMYYQTGQRTVASQFEGAMAENSRLKFQEIGDLQPDEVTLATYLQKENWVKFGKSVFATHCTSCHGAKGEGKVGPNLTDEAFKHIRTLPDIAKVIEKGANNGAMPAWGHRLQMNEIVLVSVYVASLRGTNIEGGKPAEGQEIPAWPEPPSDAVTEDATEDSGEAEAAEGA
ncbi:MAG: cytochrome C oxidase Cbb3 [Rhodopirellula sp. TMED11]|nr:MAG: cytochrome C oxidase Cbb3 [Rhodopirellula sp. TMED11]